jgi:hypothetical protein
MSARNTALAFALALCASVPATTASANQAAEAFLSAWVETIDSSPDWRATYETIVSDGASDTTIVSGFRITSERRGFALSVDSIALTGLVPSSDGTLAAASIRLDGGEVATGFVRLQIADAEFRDFLLPVGRGFAWSADRPVAAMIKALSPLASLAMSSGRIASLALFQTFEGVESRIAYENVEIGEWSGGRIATISAGPILSQSPDIDQLAAMAVVSAESRNIDLNAFLAVYDPDNYANGVGDGMWRPAIGQTVYRELIAAIPGVVFTMQEATVQGLRLRQPDDGIAAPADSSSAAAAGNGETFDPLALLSTYGIDALTLRDMEVRAPGIDEMRLARLSISDFSTDMLGEMALDGLALAVPDAGAVRVGRFAFGGLVPPAREALFAALAAQESGDRIDIPSIIPMFGFVEATGVDVAVVGLPETRLERLRLDLGDYVGPVPTTVAVDIAGADLDSSLVVEPRARGFLDDFGYDRVVLDTAFQARWARDGTIVFDGFSFAMKDVAALSGDLVFAGIAPTEFWKLGDPAELEKLELVRGSLTATDATLVASALTQRAEQLDVDPAEFRDQFVIGLPFMLTFLGDPKLQAQLAPVLQAFIRTAGGSITMSSNPSTPLPLAQLFGIATQAPFELLKALQAEFSGTPGTAPASSPAN